jgi:hypothetical protein
MSEVKKKRGRLVDVERGRGRKGYANEAREEVGR